MRRGAGTSSPPHSPWAHVCLPGAPTPKGAQASLDFEAQNLGFCEGFSSASPTELSPAKAGERMKDTASCRCGNPSCATLWLSV